MEKKGTLLCREKITEDQEVGVQLNRHWDRHGGQLKDQFIAGGRGGRDRGNTHEQDNMTLQESGSRCLGELTGGGVGVLKRG